VTIRDIFGTEQTIRVTDEHPFYVVGKGWIKASDLAGGDNLLTPRGDQSIVVDNIGEGHCEGITVFNVEVDEFHTYFVKAKHVDAEPIWVHNAGYDRRQIAQMMADEGELTEIEPWDQSPDHHIFPKAKEEWFRARGVNVDDYTLTVDWGTHDALHYGGGPGKPGGWWNDRIMANLVAREASLGGGQLLTPAEIMQEGQRMLRVAKLDSLTNEIHPYNSRKV
jgi:hypothetical protein